MTPAVESTKVPSMSKRLLETLANVAVLKVKNYIAFASIVVVCMKIWLTGY